MRTLGIMVLTAGLAVAAVPAANADIFEGTQDDDVLVGTVAGDQMFGFYGDDRIRALGGRDVAIGGPDADRLAGGHGRDSLHGDAPPGERADAPTTGSDRVRGGPGGDLITTGPRADKVWPGLGRDRVATGRGPDILFVRADGKPDTYRCGRAVDRVGWWGEPEKIDTLISCEIIHIAAP